MLSMSDLPVELLDEIMQCFHHYRDRPSLLFAALVSKDWGTASQRVLFSAVTDHHDELAHPGRVREIHRRFLRTINKFPSRLGPLIHSYAQCALTCDPASTGTTYFPGWESSVELWRLTANALPAMVNLKHLYFTPGADVYPAEDDWASSRMLLSSFAFQLKTLTWGSCFHPHNGMLGFLATQRELIHLATWRSRDFPDCSWLEDHMCPQLISVACDCNSFSHVAKTRRIIAWECNHVNRKETAALVAQVPSVLRTLKYLSVESYHNLHYIFGPIDVTIILLEVPFEFPGRDSKVPHFSNLPTLRVLVLIQYWRKSDAIPDFIFTRSTLDGLCEQLPSLEYVIHRFWNSYGKFHRYMKLSLSPDSPEDILQEELDIHHDLAVPWWSIYNV